MGIHTFLLLIGALLMRLGLAVMNVGSVRSKNAAAALARHVLDLAVATLAMWLTSYLLAGGDDGRSRDFLQLMPILASGALIGAMHLGATSERSRLWPMLGLSLA